MSNKAVILSLVGIFWSSLLSLNIQTALAVNTSLRLTPQNTVIVNGDESATRTLQYYLIKYYVDATTAEPYAIDNRKINRADSPNFPVIQNSRDNQVPDGKLVLAVGTTQFLTVEDKVILKENPDSVLLRRRNNIILIAGNAGNAVSEFLNYVCGIRFYAPDDLWVSRPQKNYIEVGKLDFFRPQAFIKSFLAPPANPRNREWAHMNYNASRLTLHTNHSLARMFPPSKYAETHPDIYEMRNGRRIIPAGTAWQPSLVANDLPALAMDYVREQMKKNPQLKYISFGMMDTPFNDETPAAQESVQRYGDYSHLYFGFLNKVAVQVQKEFPGLLLTAYSYTNAQTPPRGMRIEHNIVVDIVTTTYNFVIPGNMEQTKARIQAYIDLGAQVMLHDWNFSGISPRSYMPQLAIFLQWCKSRGVLGVYTEWFDGESWYLDGAKYWILMQLMSDPYQDVDMLWKTYCDDMYGKGSEAMYRLFQHYHGIYMYAPGRIALDDLPRQEPTLYNPEDLAYERSLIEKALTQTIDDSLAQQRLSKVLHYFRAHELFAQATAKAAQLDRQFTGSGINKPLLEYYLNDDGKNLERAIEYYDNSLSIPPDSHVNADKLGARISYINNYTRGVSTLLSTIRKQALQATDPKQINITKVNAHAERILRDNLPQKYLPARMQQFKEIVSRSILIPRTKTLPVIDGELSDIVWKNAVPLTGFTERDTLRISENSTEGKIMRVDDSLIIGITAYQKNDIWAVTPKEIETGARIWRESACEFFFGPTTDLGKKSPYAQYVVNVLEAYQGFAAAKNNREGVQVAVKLDKDKKMYTMEIVLPLKTSLYDYSQEKVLSFNVTRDVFTHNSYEADVILGWYPVFYSATVPESRGLIFME